MRLKEHFDVARLYKVNALSLGALGALTRFKLTLLAIYSIYSVHYRQEDKKIRVSDEIEALNVASWG